VDAPFAHPEPDHLAFELGGGEPFQLVLQFHCYVLIDPREAFEVPATELGCRTTPQERLVPG
jgi:hypothetical protein